jgi:hypothetical protein
LQEVVHNIIYGQNSGQGNFIKWYWQQYHLNIWI